MTTQIKSLNFNRLDQLDEESADYDDKRLCHVEDWASYDDKECCFFVIFDFLSLLASKYSIFTLEIEVG